MEETSVATTDEPIPREPDKYCLIFNEADLQYRPSLSSGNERFIYFLYACLYRQHLGPKIVLTVILKGHYCLFC